MIIVFRWGPREVRDFVGRAEAQVALMLPSNILCGLVAEREGNSNNPFSDVRSFLARGRNSRSGALALLMGSPKIFNFRGERRQLSPNDASVIHCDLLAEREGPLVPRALYIRFPLTSFA